MALFKCSECGKEISDKAKQCIHCGYPLENHEDEIRYEVDMKECPYCGYANKQTADYCNGCGKRITECQKRVKGLMFRENEYSGITDGPHTICPACGGMRFHAFIVDEVISPAKVKSRTTLNLNPLKPFTVFNHKEKVVRKPWIKQVSKFVCDDCGKIFGD